MAITFTGGRQWPLVGKVTVGFADLVSGVEALFENMPPTATITKMYLNVLTAFDSVTSDVLDVGDEDTATLYQTSADLQVVGLSELTPTGKKYTAPTQLSMTWTGSGTAPTAGEFEVIFEYIMDGRANETVPKRKSQ
jgi:hypothetical protein